ncbi:hypothetical protein F0L74_16665 [Chitinophaga agrisoli]|uniref:Uncharacterized protein n=1 Tax=Chitinophaga agrisoli TaxID=2607653 RepID=A0A5B2VTF6_9BACT|nr:hypothetical protein [Chitinophaga agrisoli]KAA2241527.1 hypothetical protein F0L74_16665 [Chitinophaga agrisoli]
MKFDKFYENGRPLTLATIPNYLEAFDFQDKPLPVGHEALQGYSGGTNDVINELKRLLIKHPNVEETFKEALLELIENRDKFNDELSELWDDDNGGYKGLRPDY